MRTLILASTITLGFVTAQAQTETPVRVIEDGVLDEIQLFVEKLPDPYRRVSIKPFESAGADLGTGGKDGEPEEQEESKLMQKDGPGFLAEALAKELRAKQMFDPVGDDAPRDIAITGRFVELNPGSRAKRYWVGFGAGKAVVAVAGEVRDAKGNVLASFRQRRIATAGWGGGDSIKKMRSDCRSIGKDLANFLHAWAAGKRLD